MVEPANEPMNEPVVLVEEADAIATVRINRPKVLNALNGAVLTALRDAFVTLARSDRVRVIILTGAAERAFAAGADIRAMRAQSPDAARQLAWLGHEATRAIEAAPQPVIAAVRGFALGGGCEFALACDLRIAATDAVFGQPEVGLGIPPGWGATQRLPRLIGPERAKEMIFTGRRVEAEEALRIGLVSRVVPPESLLEAAHETAQMIAQQAPGAIAAAKRAVNYARDTALSVGLAYEAEVFAAAFATADQREGMTAFIEKRQPRFGGKIAPVPEGDGGK